MTMSFVLFHAMLLASAGAYSTSDTSRDIGRISAIASRRSALGTILTLATGLATSRHADAAVLTNPDILTDVYFGVGCFWHIQHEFIGAERELLGRNDNQLSSRTGYAGGTRVDKEGRVCYHNFNNIADYGKMGHGEVVGMTIPEKSIGDFAKVYFSLFNPKTRGKLIAIRCMSSY